MIIKTLNKKMQVNKEIKNTVIKHRIKYLNALKAVVHFHLK